MVFYLHLIDLSVLNTDMQYTRKTGFSTVDGQINRIIRCMCDIYATHTVLNIAITVTLETGSLTAIAALLDVTFFLVFPVRELDLVA